MKYKNTFDKFMESKGLNVDEFVANLGDEDERKEYYAKIKKESFKEDLIGLLNEYVAEAEHQDGYGYWENFEDNKEILRDFMLYLQNSNYLDELYEL